MARWVLELHALSGSARRSTVNAVAIAFIPAAAYRLAGEGHLRRVS
jgi:hypothetical protein